jgi:hypothetical protein
VKSYYFKIKLLSSPFSFDVQNAPYNLQLKFTDLQGDKELKQKFIYVKLSEFLGLLSE